MYYSVFYHSLQRIRDWYILSREEEIIRHQLLLLKRRKRQASPKIKE